MAVRLYGYETSLHVAIAILLMIVSVSCDKPLQGPKTHEGKMLASVGSKILYESDLINVIHPNTKSQDSIGLATAYIDQWIRDQLITREAKNSFSSDIGIEQLVADYREKLLKFNLEERIINERYDTVISEGDLLTYYESIKDQFVLEEEICRGLYIKMDRKQQGLKDFTKEWNNKDDNPSMYAFARAYNIDMEADTTSWRTWTELNTWYNGWSKSKARSLSKQRQNDKEYEYFLKIVGFIDKGEFSPLEYIKPQLTKMLLLKRRQGIIETYKQELYEKALRNNLIKIQ